MQIARKYGVLAHMAPRDTAVVRSPDLGPDDVAETAVDDCVQVQRVADPQQVGRNNGADTTARPARVMVIVDVVPQLSRVVGIVTAGAFIDDPVMGITPADQHDR